MVFLFTRLTLFSVEVFGHYADCLDLGKLFFERKTQRIGVHVFVCYNDLTKKKIEVQKKEINRINNKKRKEIETSVGSIR